MTRLENLNGRVLCCLRVFVIRVWNDNGDKTKIGYLYLIKNSENVAEN